MPTFHVPKPGERPDVEVLVDGTWCPGELRMWTQHDNGDWAADVQYRPPGAYSSHLATFPECQVRKNTIDRSRGRH